MKKSIEKSRIFVIVYKYIHKFFYFSLLIALFVAFLYDLTVISFFVFYFIAVVIVFHTDKSMSKVAYRIDLDMDNKLVTFHMLKGGKVQQASIGRISHILVNGNIIYEINGNTIFWHSPNFNDQNEILFLKSISSVCKIKWGWLCNIYGPNSKIRHEINAAP